MFKSNELKRYAEFQNMKDEYQAKQQAQDSMNAEYAKFLGEKACKEIASVNKRLKAIEEKLGIESPKDEKESTLGLSSLPPQVLGKE